MNRKINAVCFALILAGTCAIAWQSCTPKQEEVANVTEQPNGTEQLDVAEQPTETEQPVEVVQPTEILSETETVAAPFVRKNAIRNPAKALNITDLPELAPGDSLGWAFTNDHGAKKYSATFYKVDESSNKTELYVMNEHCYTDYRFLSKDKQKLWFLVHNDDDHERSTYYGVYVLDGIAGTVDYLTEADFIYLSADGEYFVCWESTPVISNSNSEKKETFYFYVCNAKTGENIAALEWVLKCYDPELSFSSTIENPLIMHVTYSPEGIEYAEAEIHLDTMTLEVIRDDTNLSYDELPAQYKMNIHP